MKKTDVLQKCDPYGLRLPQEIIAIIKNKIRKIKDEEYEMKMKEYEMKMKVFEDCIIPYVYRWRRTNKPEDCYLYRFVCVGFFVVVESSANVSWWACDLDSELAFS